MRHNNSDTERPVEVRGWIELFCWTVVVLAPFLTWVNGPAVSTDQFVVRAAVFTIALASAISLSVARFLLKRRR